MQFGARYARLTCCPRNRQQLNRPLATRENVSGIADKHADEPFVALLVYKARDVYEEALGSAIDGRLKEQFAQFAHTLDVTATIADWTLEAVSLAAAA